jgi:hypothetical protein
MIRDRQGSSRHLGLLPGTNRARNPVTSRGNSHGMNRRVNSLGLSPVLGPRRNHSLTSRLRHCAITVHISRRLKGTTPGNG